MSVRRIKLFAASSLIVLIALCGVWTSSANAQRRIVVRPAPRVFIAPGFHRGFFGYPYWGYPYWYSSYYYNSPWYLQEQGYHDGISRGKSDARHRKPNDPSSHKHYRNSESLTYRNAFLQGYHRGYHDYVRR